MYKELGDLGDVAARCKHRQSMLVPLPPLTVADVFGKLKAIAAAKGTKSAARKQQLIAGMLRACRRVRCRMHRTLGPHSCALHSVCGTSVALDPVCCTPVAVTIADSGLCARRPAACRGVEIKYVVRTLIRNLRVGASWRSVVTALGRAAAFHSPTGPPGAAAATLDKATLDRAAALAVDAYHRCPNISRIVGGILDVGVWRLEEACGVQVAVPLQPMLAKITEGFDDCVNQMRGKSVLAEYKYDGQRAQIHVSSAGEVRRCSHSVCYKTVPARRERHRVLEL